MIQQTLEKLHALHLAAMADALQSQMTQPDIDAMPFDERLGLLVDLQHSAVLNAQLKQRLKRAGMRQTACIENLNLRAPRNLDRGAIHTLATGQWIRRNLNVLVLGPSGIGKSWVSCPLGNQAARESFPLAYKRLSRLLDDLAAARLLPGRQACALTTLARTRVLIIDDWLMQKLTAEQRRDLMEVIDDRHGRASTIIATQMPVDRWHDMIGDPTYADAILDRLIHNTYRLDLKGKTLRTSVQPIAEDKKIS
jgi:DNA replication protein DnaC